jgi:hypothetical protein
LLYLRGAPISEKVESSSSGDDDDSSDIDSTEAEQRRSSTSKHSQWSDLDEQRLLAYKRANLGKFPGRTRAAVRTRWT